ncbi:hypothetical protein BUALT_Bualt06G0055700 [Buddleja alternifolia]|uniref:Clp R domain-containing protein n=1 Tax=Buddleja alternifolia TaxID=168488 RepID=A0AAV6XNU1_9LAMI|nr:hypothetical protein BUALT_Bualt06G0055700 [Buddleja alternifolia]
MPTPVDAARQCLTQEAATVLDEAVAVARRRGHGQTTSLHMISSLLSLPNSSLREACTRTRNNAYSTRVQFKALELSLSVSLDRLPSLQAAKVEEPPVSNSLMAAVKRSQANQRRQPENFTFYQQQQQQYSSSCSSVPVVKVELQNLVLSILDDPSVSRVFGEAGFRSCDIKLATLRPGNSFHAHQVFGYMSRYSKRPNPPLFLYSDNTNTNDVGLGGKGFRFPFMGCFSGDENSIKIGEVMVRDKKRNPLLLGVSANDALRSFLETVERKVRGALPEELNGLSVVCIKDEVLRFVNGDCDEGVLRLRFEEVERVLENVVGGGGVVVNIGDFQGLGGDGVGFDGLRYLVSEFGRLMAIHGGKLWVIGAAATYEIYFKILNKFPSIEDDLDLEILPITSLRFSVGGSYPRSSLMDSFVPLGGFFSMPPETKSPLSNTSQYVVRCHLCNEKYEQEVVALSKGGLSASVVQQYHASLPSWLQIAESGTQTGSAPIKGKDDRLLLNAKIKGLQNKWDGICHQHHYNQTFSKGYTHQLGYPFPRVLGFQVSEDCRENPSNDGNNHSNESSTEPGNKNVTSTLSTDLQHSPSKGFRSLDMLSKAHNLSLLSKSGEIPSESKGMNDRHTSPTSVTSVTTDLGLGIISEKLFKSSSCDNHTHSMVKDSKLLYKALLERVGQQEEAISSVIQAITRTGLHGVNRSDIWMNFRGPDRLGKIKIGVVLAEILYGSIESFIYADLSFQEEMVHTDVILNSRVTNKYDLTMRGTVVDYLVEKLSKKPCVVFLENIDKADLVVQNSLSLAVKTGRFADLRGREVNISNSIFIGTTTRSIEGGQSHEESSKYLEEDISRVKGSLIQILIRFDLNDDLMSENKKQLSDSTLMNKRKLMGQRRRTDECGSLEIAKRAHKASNSYLDLNLPAEGSEICNTYSEESDSESNSENQWLEDFESQIDQNQIIVFNQFDFDTLAEKQFKEISQCLHKIVGSECSLEMEPKVMKQLIAAEYLFGNNRVEDWIECVLKQGFVEAMGKFGLNARSIVKLVTCEGTISEEQPKSLLLPAKIIMN